MAHLRLIDIFPCELCGLCCVSSPLLIGFLDLTIWQLHTNSHGKKSVSFESTVPQDIWFYSASVVHAETNFHAIEN